MSASINRHTLTEVNELIAAAKTDRVGGLGDLLSQIGHNAEVVKDEIRQTRPATLESVSGVGDADMILLQVFDKLDNAGKVAVIRSGISAKTKLAEEQLALLEKHEAVKLRGWVAKAAVVSAVLIAMAIIVASAYSANSGSAEASAGVMSSMFEVIKLVFGGPVN